jgi:hypothetical protein
MLAAAHRSLHGDRSLNKAQLIELVRDFGRERYRCGKANIRGELAKSGSGRHRNKEKAAIHAKKSVLLIKQIEDALDQGPYADA